MRNRIAEKMRDILLQAGRKSVWYGDIDILEMCANQCNICTTHPQKTIRLVLNSLPQSVCLQYQDHLRGTRYILFPAGAEK